jgi:hypothetical protein
LSIGLAPSAVLAPGYSAHRLAADKWGSSQKFFGLLQFVRIKNFLLDVFDTGVVFNTSDGFARPPGRSAMRARTKNGMNDKFNHETCSSWLRNSIEWGCTAHPRQTYARRAPYS